MSDALFELYTKAVSADQLRIVSFRGDEELCGAFRLAITVAAPVAVGESLAEQLFGQRATFIAHAASPMVRRGVITQVAIGGSLDPEQAELTLTLASRLELLDLRTNSRVFENVSPAEALAALAREWEIPSELKLVQSYSKRRYITQYRETDLAFLRRIASRDGIGFYLAHPELGASEKHEPGDERLVFYDHAEAYPVIPSGDDLSRGNHLVHDRQGFDTREHHVTGFRLERTMMPELVRMGDFDFKRPGLALRASAAVPSARRSPINSSLGGERLSVYLHGDRAELDAAGGRGEISDELAGVRLQQAQRGAEVGRGRSRCMRLAPGATFTLDEQTEAPGLNQSYVLTRLSHQGRIAEVTNASLPQVYENELECTPATVVFRPPLPSLDLRQVTETATVVGPEGHDLHCDEHGRVLVRFHWDTASKGEGSCWLRVLTPWAGTSWGSQFLPRVGMEVLVGFLSGDVDQPIVLGAVYNGTHPTPFALPAEAAKAGFKSRSTPGGESGSELTFDDSKGRERFVLKAERDMSQHVEHDLDSRVGRNEAHRVTGESARTIGGTATTEMLADHVVSVASDFEQRVGGSQSIAISKNLDLRVTGNRTERIEGRDQTEQTADALRIVHGDATERVTGHKITVVGEHEERRSNTVHVEGSSHSFASGAHEIVSDKEIVLRCGDTTLRLTPEGLEVVAAKVRFVSKEITVEADDKIELFTKKQLAIVAEAVDVLAEKKVLVRGEQAKLVLAKDARLDGSVVKLNCDPEPPDPLEPPPYEPPELTKVELYDETGAPLARRQVLVTHGDGSERIAVLDDDGKLSLYLNESAEISFPETDGARRG